MKTLSKAEKVVQIKTILQAIPTYTISTFKVTTGMCKVLDSLIKKLQWSNNSDGERYMTLKTWDEIYKPKIQEDWAFEDSHTLIHCSNQNWAG